MKKLKDERGALTLLVLVTMLFVLSFLITTHIIVSNKLQGQMRRSKEIQKIYNNYEEANNIYKGLLGGRIINITTVEQLLKIGTDEVIYINEKPYVFSDDAVYVLMEDLSFVASEQTEILNGLDWKPIGDTNINFEGNGHTITVTRLNGIIKIYNEENEYKD